uniref:Uncharacterized protein n=1 Tax=Arundo donax TaxID=35708 RepID=A0A0A9EM09_ARUDO
MVVQASSNSYIARSKICIDRVVHLFAQPALLYSQRKNKHRHIVIVLLDRKTTKDRDKKEGKKDRRNPLHWQNKNTTH